jgi:SAM-dependent methyltransferase
VVNPESKGTLPLSVQRQLLSARMQRSAAGHSVMPLSPTQQQYLGDVERWLQTDEVRWVNEPCPCHTSQACDDVCVAEIDRYGLALDSVLCLACGTVRLNPYLDEPSLDQFYRHSYQELYGRKNDLPHLFSYQRSHYGERIADLYGSCLTERSAVLEIGCGTGGATVAFRERGCFAAGCDFSSDLVQYGASRGLSQLWTGTIDDAPAAAAGRHYDLIYLFHVLEHVARPAQLLEQLRGRLAPGGRILAVVPDLFRIDVHRNPAGDALKFLHIAHKFNFSEAGLTRMASQASLSARRIEPPQRDEAAVADARHLSELWIEFSPSAETSGHAKSRVGDELLRYLLTTEQLFLARRCPAQRAIADRAAAQPPAARPATNTSVSRPQRWYERLPLIGAARQYWRQSGNRAA